jgi:glycosyltransferase involved in cell wall biosynthesis
MRILIGIATYKRINKLQRLLDSINKQTYKDIEVAIVCDNNDLETYTYLLNLQKTNILVYPLINDKQEYVIGCWNKIYAIFNNKYDAYLTLVDDVELFPNFVEEMVKCMNTNFPDLDGVVGSTQECPGHPEFTFKIFGQTMVGNTFLNRYREIDFKFCCIDYFHFFQDEEMYLFSTELNKFIHCKKAILNHYHPAFINEEKDETHFIVRDEIIRNDTKTFNKRKEKKILWGLSWKLINKYAKA